MCMCMCVCVSVCACISACGVCMWYVGGSGVILMLTRPRVTLDCHKSLAHITIYIHVCVYLSHGEKSISVTPE